MFLILALILALGALIYVATSSLLWAVIAAVVLLIVYGGSARAGRWR